MILYMYIAPGQGQTAPRRQSFDANRNVLSLHSFVASFKKCLWSLILYIFFFSWFINVYSPGAGADNPLRAKFWCQQEYLVTSVICCKFQKKLFEVWFYLVVLEHPTMHTKIKNHRPFGSGEDRPSWSCDQDHLSIHSFPHPIEAPHEIWLWLAQWFLRRRHLKSVDDDGRQKPTYPVSSPNEPTAQVS